jgi:2'-5' RNA ligase
MIRLFAALAVPDAAAAALAPLRGGVPGARWSPGENLHITLRFFGDIDEARAEDLAGELGRVSAEPFDVTLAGVGAFAVGRDVNAIWAGVEAGEAISRLAARCETAARRSGLKADTRVWKPHVTLAYLRHAEPTEVAAWIQTFNRLRAPSFRVARFGLYSSWRSDGGSVYHLERDYPFRLPPRAPSTPPAR